MIKYCQEHHLKWLEHPVKNDGIIIDDSLCDNMDLNQELHEALMTLKVANKRLKKEGLSCSH